MGDPAGVGPEICLKLLHNKDIARICTPIIFGCSSVLEQAATKCNLGKPELIIKGLSEADRPCVLNINTIDLNEFTIGTANAKSGQAAYSYIYNYTIGQRRGLNISHTAPLYVIKLNSKENEVIALTIG